MFEASSGVFELSESGNIWILNHLAACWRPERKKGEAMRNTRHGQRRK
jgi:hypothetical protein